MRHLADEVAGHLAGVSLPSLSQESYVEQDSLITEDEIQKAIGLMVSLINLDAGGRVQSSQEMAV